MTTGVWFVGARGSVATTALVGALAVRAGMAPPTGLLSDAPELAGAGLPGLDELVFGGHDVVDTPLGKRAEQLAAAGVVPSHLPGALAAELAAADARVRTAPGAAGDEAGQDQDAVARRIVADLEAFRADNALDRVVVVNVSSTEPPAQDDEPAHASLAALEQALADGRSVLPASSVYAYAAFTAGCSFVDFTPSTGARIPALDELARLRGLPYAGSDGKTGETLMKSALAPMFTARGLRVQSWVGMNILGGGDGATLADPEASLSKTRSKGRSLDETLGYDIDAPVHIDYVPDMGEWKTAWDHVSFEGFLGTRMALQFTWQGCDSALAAPLVLDLARFTARAHEAGESGALAALGFYFKDPVGTREHRLFAQHETLLSWALGLPALGLPVAERP